MVGLPTSVRVALILLWVDSLIWLSFGVAAASGGIASLADPPALRWVMAGLAWAAGAVLAGLTILLRRRSRPAFYLALLLLTVITVLSIADQIGVLDLVALAFSVIPLVLLLKDRAWYERRTRPAS